MGNCKSSLNSTDIEESSPCFASSVKDAELDKKQASSLSTSVENGRKTRAPRDHFHDWRKTSLTSTVASSSNSLHQTDRIVKKLNIKGSWDDTNHVNIHSDSHVLPSVEEQEEEEKAQDNLLPRDVPYDVSKRSLMSMTSSIGDQTDDPQDSSSSLLRSDEWQSSRILMPYEQNSSRSLLQKQKSQKSFRRDSNQQDHEAFQIFEQLRRISNEWQNSVASMRSQTQTLTMDQLHNEHETEEEAQERRKRFIDAFQIKKQEMWNNKTASMQMIENKAIDWSEKYATMNKMRSMNKFFEQMRDYILQDEKLRNTFIRKHLRRRAWMESFVKLDPRFQIHAYFTEVAREGGPLEDPLVSAPMSIIRAFRRGASFSVWRPTSNDAISLMMKGQATGKGLEVKGKSAKCGRLSGLIPFIQIYEEQHKNIGKLGLRKDGRVRVYFKSDDLRAAAIKRLLKTIHQMMQVPVYVPNMVDDTDDNMDFRWEVEDYGIHRLTEGGYGIDVSERVFYQACVIDQHISRTGDLETGRASEPNFQAMNFDSTRSYSGIGPRTVVYQVDDQDPLKPQTFVVAYEENKSVAPVASDFDCFTVGTRGVVYDEPMSNDQVELMKWMIESIDGLLEKPVSDRSWASHWFDVLDKKDDRKMIDIPRFGFGDPKSYQIMEGAVMRFAHNKNGAVRHGAECFNYKFPQEIDDKLLVIADYGEIDGTNRPFKYMTPSELQEFMLDKLDEGFVFPLNPKWIIADVGWKRVYEKMMASKDSSIQQSLETWYPKASGVRRLIDQVYEKHPNGFMNTGAVPKMEGTEALDLMQQQLRRKEILRRALFKFRMVYHMQQTESSRHLKTYSL
ncbi:hypothetical protein CTEN210_04292 [Chaetoceros tenuissimus]|uniref:Uncharacterized protein n=1 Tax=Chaetoceros tenuissimus TaxID=426638 RepID=A0AAD3CKX5_9STRA|nr:hypothetical protein CTEN210_04292 [Chaetoceros tenuissimus]